MFNIQPSLKPIIYIVLMVLVCVIFEFIHPEIKENPVKKIYFSNIKKKMVEPSKDTIAYQNQGMLIASNVLYPEVNKADSMAISLLASDFLLNKHHKSENPVIRYYTKPLDGKAVYELNNYGFYVHERHSNNLQKFKSNVIHYGDSVGLDKIQIIAYVLMSGGLDIKEIAPSRYHAGWKYNSVEVGADTTLLKNTSISYTDLYKLNLGK